VEAVYTIPPPDASEVWEWIEVIPATERHEEVILRLHEHGRASRYVESMADLQAHPEIFRCPVPSCNLVLDGPE
jgi:hypothetical protein